MVLGWRGVKCSWEEAKGSGVGVGGRAVLRYKMKIKNNKMAKINAKNSCLQEKY